MEMKEKRKQRRENIRYSIERDQNKRNQELLYQFKNVMRISQRIKRKDVAQALCIPESELLKRLVYWGDQYPFKIDKDEIIVEDLSQFVSVLDNQFNEWDKREQAQDGKI